MKKKITFLLAILALQLNAFSQELPRELESKIKGKLNLKQIMTEVEAYYKAEEEAIRRISREPGTAPIEFESDLLKWKRWSILMPHA